MLDKYFAHLDTAREDFSFLKLEQLWSSQFWFIVNNEFPYDKVATTHHLLVPFRVFQDDWEMTHAEREELMGLKRSFAGSKEYDAMQENIAHRRSVPRHYHLHLIKYKNITDYHG